jgi:preprotein translocase subunit YajC
MLFSTLLLLAEEAAPKIPFFLRPEVLLGLLLLFWLIVLRPGNRRAEQERRTLVASTEKNDKVLTAAGIYGTVVSVNTDEDWVMVKVDDNVKLKMTRGSIARNLSKEEKAREATKEAAK